MQVVVQDVLWVDIASQSPQALAAESRRLPPDTAEGFMPNIEFTAADMQIVLMANERVILALKLTDNSEHMGVKARISALIMQCAEDGERDLQKLIDCAHAGLANDSPCLMPDISRGKLPQAG
jgi:hypothetical protein